MGEAARVARVAATAVPSPCTQVCAIDPATGWCSGCLRSLDEIAAWGGLDDAGKRAICQQLPARRESLQPARSGSLEAKKP